MSRAIGGGHVDGHGALTLDVQPDGAVHGRRVESAGTLAVQVDCGADRTVQDRELDVDLFRVCWGRWAQADAVLALEGAVEAVQRAGVSTKWGRW